MRTIKDGDLVSWRCIIKLEFDWANIQAVNRHDAIKTIKDGFLELYGIDLKDEEIKHLSST